MSAAGRIVRVCAGLMLASVVMATGAATADAAEADTRRPQERTQQQGECRDLWRKWLEVPDVVETADQLDIWGTPTAELTGAADEFLIRYCVQPDGTWHKTEDHFPYNDSDMCVYVNEVAGAGMVAPQAGDGAVESPDQHGQLEPRGAAGAADAEMDFYYFCRDGDRWQLSDAPEADVTPNQDRPEGSYDEWSDECLTILPTGGDLPATLEEHPSHQGSTDYPIERLDVRELKTYCLPRGNDPQTGPWYLVEDYPLTEVADQSGRAISDPDQGTCVVIVDPIMEGGFPEVITPPGSPADWGGIVLPEDYANHPYGDYGQGDEPPATSLFCWMGLAWVRGDVMGEGCRALGDLDVLKNRPGRGLLPDDCWGSFPSDSYDIGYNGGAINHVGSKITGWFTDTFFSVGKGATSVALWSIDWAYGFEMGDFESFAVGIGDKYRMNLTENVRFRLGDVVFFVLAGWVAITVLRGKFALAGGEVVMTLVLMTLAGVLMANRAGYMSAVDGLMEDASIDLMLAGQGHDPADEGTNRDVGAVIDGVQAQIHKAFIEEPYDYLNWGGLLSGDCAKARNTILAQGPWGDSDAPRTTMTDAGCQAQADFNAKPTGTRLLASGFAMLAAIMVSSTLTGVALTVVVGKVIALLLFAVAPFAVLTAGLPAGLRRLTWVWVMSLLQVVVTVIAMGLVLSLLLLSVDELLQSVKDIGLVERFAMVLIVVLLFNAIRRRATSSAESSAGRLADNMTNFRLGGGSHWVGPSGSSGLGITSVEDTLRRGVGRATATAAWAGGATVAAVGAGAVGTLSNSWNRWRTGRVSLGNLRRMERYRERRDGLPSPPWRAGRSGRGGGGAGGPAPGGGAGGPAPGGGGGPGPRPGPGPGGGRPRPGPGARPGGRGGARPGGPRPGGSRTGPGGPGGPTPWGGRGGPGGPGPRNGPGGGAGGHPPPSGWVSTQWELAKDRLRLDRSAEVAGNVWRSASGHASGAWRGSTAAVGRGWANSTAAAGRGWDRSTAAVGRRAGNVTGSMGVRHPGPGGRPMRVSTFEQRWREREAARPPGRQPGWRVERSEERRGVNAQYLARRRAERATAETIAKGRRRLTPEERRNHLRSDRSPREERRQARREVDDRYIPPD